jgi:cyclophilin family peptidyl-prolyl cis-trans isomerase
MIKYALSIGLALILASVPTLAATRVKIQTSQGIIVLDLDEQKAPQTVASFVQYARDGFYDGTIFHRVIGDFMIQGGGFTEDYQRKPTRSPIKNEADNGLKNTRGTIAMARTSDPHSATSQFFINVKDNDFLNYRAPNPQGWGYTVFGQVIEGMDVVDKISRTSTGPGGPFPKDAPQSPIVIEKVVVIQDGG